MLPKKKAEKRNRDPVGPPQRLYAVGGIDDAGAWVRSCYSLDVGAGAWVAEAPMLEGRCGQCVAVVHGELWAVGGSWQQ